MNWELQFGEASWFAESEVISKTDYVSYHKPKTERTE